jgi:hypothetical protein
VVAGKPSNQSDPKRFIFGSGSNFDGNTGFGCPDLIPEPGKNLPFFPGQSKFCLKSFRSVKIGTAVPYRTVSSNFLSIKKNPKYLWT